MFGEKRLSTFQEKIMQARKDGVTAVDLQFTSLLGALKSKAVSLDEFEHEEEFRRGYGVDGSSVRGFGVPVEESDLILVPDETTFNRMPWLPHTARVICDVFHPTPNSDQVPFEGDARQVLKRVRDQIAPALEGLIAGVDSRFEFHVVPELEFFLLTPQTGDIDTRGYFDAPPDATRKLLNDIMAAMGQMGLRFEAWHHEVARSQYEFDFRYGEVLAIADGTVTLKDMIRNYATQHGLVATFMPKPFWGRNGSGMHCHLNLSRYDREGGQWKKTNLFYDPAKNGLSGIARHFIAGLLEHSPALTALTNPTCNSYKRIVPGWEAPVKIAWGQKNRTALIRVPHGHPRAARCEYRSPDPSANPYLAFAAMLAAGLDGIKRRLDPGKPAEFDLYHDPKAGGVRDLPGSLMEALSFMKNDAVLRAALGEFVIKNFVEAKEQEFRGYESDQKPYHRLHAQRRPTGIDLKWYLHI